MTSSLSNPHEQAFYKAFIAYAFANPEREKALKAMGQEDCKKVGFEKIKEYFRDIAERCIDSSEFLGDFFLELRERSIRAPAVAVGSPSTNNMKTTRVFAAVASTPTFRSTHAGGLGTSSSAQKTAATEPSERRSSSTPIPNPAPAASPRLSGTQTAPLPSRRTSVQTDTSTVQQKGNAVNPEEDEGVFFFELT